MQAVLFLIILVLKSVYIDPINILFW